MPRVKAVLMDEATLLRTVARISHEIIEKNKGVEDVCLVGIRRRGLPLAEMIRENIRKFEGACVPCAAVDIRFYRDDLTCLAPDPLVQPAPLPFDIVGKRVILVDDVLYTGRTARAAMDAVMGLGRPRCIRLAVLIDRGHRELPIRADYVGKSIPTSHRETVSVLLPPYDAETGVKLLEQEL